MLSLAVLPGECVLRPARYQGRGRPMRSYSRLTIRAQKAICLTGMTSNIWAFLLYPSNSLTYFKKSSHDPACLFVKPYLAISGETKTLKLPFLTYPRLKMDRLTSVFPNSKFWQCWVWRKMCLLCCKYSLPQAYPVQ